MYALALIRRSAQICVEIMGMSGRFVQSRSLPIDDCGKPATVELNENCTPLGRNYRTLNDPENRIHLN